MSRFKRILRIAGAGFAAIVVAALGAVYVVSQWQLSRIYDAPLNAASAPPSPRTGFFIAPSGP